MNEDEEKKNGVNGSEEGMNVVVEEGLKIGVDVCNDTKTRPRLHHARGTQLVVKCTYGWRCGRGRWHSVHANSTRRESGATMKEQSDDKSEKWKKSRTDTKWPRNKVCSDKSKRRSDPFVRVDGRVILAQGKFAPRADHAQEASPKAGSWNQDGREGAFRRYRNCAPPVAHSPWPRRAMEASSCRVFASRTQVGGFNRTGNSSLQRKSESLDGKTNSETRGGGERSCPCLNRALKLLFD